MRPARSPRSRHTRATGACTYAVTGACIEFRWVSAPAPRAHGRARTDALRSRLHGRARPARLPTRRTKRETGSAANGEHLGEAARGGGSRTFEAQSTPEVHVQPDHISTHPYGTGGCRRRPRIRWAGSNRAALEPWTAFKPEKVLRGGRVNDDGRTTTTGQPDAGHDFDVRHAKDPDES